MVAVGLKLSWVCWPWFSTWLLHVGWTSYSMIPVFQVEESEQSVPLRFGLVSPQTSSLPHSTSENRQRISPYSRGGELNSTSWWDVAWEHREGKKGWWSYLKTTYQDQPSGTRIHTPATYRKQSASHQKSHLIIALTQILVFFIWLGSGM